MNFVKLQCPICFSVGEIKNYYLQTIDVVNILPIVELHQCKHQLCATCVRKIMQRARNKRLECPMCRHKNLYITMYSVNGNVVEKLLCKVNDVREQTFPNGLLDAASLAHTLFNKSLIDSTDNDELTKTSDLNTVISRLQMQINEQIKINYNLQLQSVTLVQANEAIEQRITNSRVNYQDACKQIEILRRTRVQEEQTIKNLMHKRVQWSERNAKLEKENEELTNENIRLIKDHNLLKH
ncbi:CG30 [Epiphyas postvittana nucleopolyhedrovirus]|uniref:CG30 n=1 Tax=Epiphyas postvittana nucleopolyhedrovirus TaxID=70600 RepID=Q91GH7_NPVEP|nr:CG30 [Epiphyas postvittana nucleopolyhedrovirus]AAK85640.1 CG30 [Epiphyas postvittana nucleopolyhedrovirus]